MAWTNILDVPGLVYEIVYVDNGSFTDPDPTVSPVGVDFVGTSNPGGNTYYRIGILITNPGGLVLPCNIRATAAGTFTAGNDYLAVNIGADTEPADPNTTGTPYSVPITSAIADTTGGVFDGGGNYVRVSGFDGGTTLDTLTLTIEVDGAIVAGEVWTDFVGTVEDSGALLKLPASIFVSGVPGQPHIDASFDCYPAIPDPPTDPPGGGGSEGGGSGPPGGGGCYNVPIYTPVMSCGGYPPDDPLATFPCTLTYIITGYIRVCP